MPWLKIKHEQKIESIHQVTWALMPRSRKGGWSSTSPPTTPAPVTKIAYGKPFKLAVPDSAVTTHSFAKQICNIYLETALQICKSA